MLVVVLATSVMAGCKKPSEPTPPRPPEVYVVSVVPKDVPVYLELVGQTEGYQDVEIRARVEGWLESVNFAEGSFVRKGDLLYQIDRKPLEAALAQAQADNATAKARLEKTTNDVTRYTPLAAKQAVSQQELDDARSAQQAARTQVDATAAAVEKAALDLSYTRITAPINGLIGSTLAKAGNLVGHGDATLLTTISQIDPIIFRVGIAEADYLRVTKRFPERIGKAQKKGKGNIELTLADGTVHPYNGRVGVVDRAVNPATGTLGMQLYFPNPDSVLRPGQYGKARAVLETKIGALVIPQRAVQELQNIFSVAVVTPDNTVAFRNVKVGERIAGGLWVIDEGLKPGEQVVAEGLQRIRDGMTVDPKPMPEQTASTNLDPPEEK
jgi:membrane fusion protein (multidrug efflux system)